MVNEKYNWVNALRGYAVLLVLLIHTSQQFIVSKYILNICKNGDLGVSLFFILSSFTLFNSYSKRKIVEGKYVNNNFFIRRFFRIAPYYYIAGFIYVMYHFFIKNELVNVKSLIANYFFINGLYLPNINDIPPGGWSISAEMLFYLLIPILFNYINSLKKAIVLFLMTMVLSILINHYFLSYTTDLLGLIFRSMNQWTFYFWLPNQLPVFILGIVLFYIYKHVVFSFRSGQMLLISSILLFFVFCFHEFKVDYPYYFIKREYVYGLIFVCFSIGVYTTNNKLIINRVVQKIGIVSFSMYLNHFLVLYILSFIYGGICKVQVDYIHLSNALLRNDFVFFSFYFLLIGISYFISSYTYKYIELKGIVFGDTIIEKRTVKRQKTQIIP